MSNNQKNQNNQTSSNNAMVLKTALTLGFAAFIFTAAPANANSDKSCLVGSIPTEERFEEAKSLNNKYQKELEQLYDLSIANPKDVAYDTKFKELQNSMLKHTDAYVATLAKVILPEDLEKCSEYKLSPQELKNFNDKWTEIAVRYPSNQNYVYNHKLFDRIIMEKAFAIASSNFDKR